MPPKAIFKGQTFCISGKLSMAKKDYEELITKHGGVVKDSVTAAVTVLISNQDDVKAGTQKVAAAQGKKVPIVQEGFIGACVTQKKFLDVGKFVIRGSKRKAAPAKAKPAPKKARTGPVETTDAIAVIPKSGLADEAAVVTETVTTSFAGKASITWDVELVLNDPEKGKDKFYNLQLLAGKADKSKFWFVQNWGRTGMEGTVKVDGPTDSLADAKRQFKKKYRQKTGNVWGQVATFVEAADKYKLLLKDEKKEKEAAGTWQYYLHNKVDGKKIGWYDYDEDAGKNMEKYWRQYNTNEGLGVRFVQSDYFKYEVNFTEMIQTNTKSGTRRVIRRVAVGERPSAAAPEKIPDKVAPRVEAADDDKSSDDEEPDDDEEDDAEAEEAEDAAAEEEAAEGEAAAEEPAAEAAGGGRKPPPDEAETDPEAPAEAAAAGGRKPPPDEAMPEAEAEEAEAPAAGGRKPPPEAAEPAADEDETMAATLPMARTA